MSTADTPLSEPVVVVSCDSHVGPRLRQDLRAYCEVEGLARQKCPEQLEIVDELPRNPMGKVVKPQLRQRFG